MSITGAPRIHAHFLPKFDNQSESARLTKEPACAAEARCLAVTKKHSGHLVMCPPFYSKNGSANRYSRAGEMLLREHFDAVFPGCGAARFAAWWAHAEAHGGEEPPITFHQNHTCYGKDIDPERCLDYIWLRGAVRVESGDGNDRGVSLVGTAPKEGDPTLYASDHYGILANLQVG